MTFVAHGAHAGIPEIGPRQQPVLELEGDRQRVPRLDDLEAIASDDEAEVPALQGWRRSVFGEKALALKNGELSLRIQRGRVVVG